jgi:hypothetical protein
MAAPAPSAIDPVVHAKFRLSPTDRIVTAGSCFAQHIARWLKEHGHNFLVTEPAHPLLPADLAETYQYGIYTARTGNIYTARQLLQLLHRATGQLHPTDDIWQHNGAFFDPFRPAIQPGGFPTLREYRLDRARHLACVRQAFETMDVFIFTLGLTECWANRQDGTVYPVCPGTIAGTFDPAIHHLLNFSVTETVADLRAFISEIRAANPNLRVILTVSPVPLAATALDRHVLISTTYSKSVLRVAAEILAEDPAIQYFPSYEIITSPATSHTYFAPDLRSITQDGVDHVMRLFARHIARTDAPAPAPEHADHFANLQKAMATLCEDEALDP